MKASTAQFQVAKIAQREITVQKIKIKQPTLRCIPSRCFLSRIEAKLRNIRLS